MNPLVPLLALTAASLALLVAVRERSALSTLAFKGASIVVKGGERHVIHSLADGYRIDVGTHRIVVTDAGLVLEDTIVPLVGFTELKIVVADNRVSVRRDGELVFDSGAASPEARVISSGP